MENKKNLRRISVVVSSQTVYHLMSMAAQAGWGEKDLGRIIDKLVRTRQAAEGGVHAHPVKRYTDPHTGKKYTTCSAGVIAYPSRSSFAPQCLHHLSCGLILSSQAEQVVYFFPV